MLAEFCLLSTALLRCVFSLLSNENKTFSSCSSSLHSNISWSWLITGELGTAVSGNPKTVIKLVTVLRKKINQSFLRGT